VTDNRNRDWLMRKIQHPEQLLAEKIPSQWRWLRNTAM